MRQKVFLKSFFVLSSVVFFSANAGIAHAQTTCLSYPSGTTAPSGYAQPWDVYDGTHPLLVKTNCPTSGTTLNLTIGKGDPANLAYKISYSYHPGMTPPWQPQTLSGTVSSGDWLAGNGTGTLTAPLTASATNPFFFVGYTCQLRSSVWKCGCADTICTTGKWQLQGYKGNGGGTSGGTTGGTGGTTGGGSNRSGLPWKSGSSPGTTDAEPAVSNTAGFGAWRGRLDDVGVTFIGQNGWTESYAAMANNEAISPGGAAKAMSNAGIVPVVTVPLVTAADRGRFAYVAAGNIDSEHQTIANKIASTMGTAKIYLRVGHEADEGYPWSYTGHGGSDPDPAIPADYKAAWRRIAKIYKDTVPGAVIVWNVLKNTRQKVVDYYPGDDVVDVISIDVYDNGSGGYCNSATSPGWINYCLGDFNPSTGVSKGIGGILKFAKLHGKKIAADEWGATNKTHTETDGANNSFFVKGMHDFFAANAAFIEYESYYNRAGGGDHQIWPRVDYNGLVSDAYKNAYQP